MGGGGTNPGLWGQVGRGQACRRSPLKGRQAHRLTPEVVPAKEARGSRLSPLGVAAAGQYSSWLLGGWGPLGAIEMDTEHAAHPPPVRSTLDPGISTETTLVKPWAALPRAAWAPLVSLVLADVPPRGWGLRGGECEIQHPETWLQPG